MVRAELSRYSTLNIPWDQAAIDSRLDEIRTKTESRMPADAELRIVEGQFTVVKTVNAPHLLSRYLSHFLATAQKSAYHGIVRIGVIDDSKDPNVRLTNKTIAEKYTLNNNSKIETVATHSKGSTNIIGRLRNYLLQITEKEGWTDSKKKEALLALQILLTDRFNINSLDKNPADTSDEYLDKHYSQFGGGAKATANIASLLSFYLMGQVSLDPSKTICNYNDDDIVIGTMVVEGGLPRLTGHDFFQERFILASNPETKFIASKYAGMPGNPVALLTSALEVTNSIIQYQQGYFPPEAQSPYYFYDPQTGEFQTMTVSQAYEKLPEIIDSFLSRTPLTAFKLPKEYSGHWLFEMGNYTLTADLVSQFPFPITGVGEFTVTGIVKTKFGVQQKTTVLETPILHLRTPKIGAHDIYPGSLISSMTTSHISVDQRAFEAALKLRGNAILPLFKQFFDRDDATIEEFLSNLPHIIAVRGNAPKLMELYRETLTIYLSQLKNSANPNQELIDSLSRLIEEVSVSNLQLVNKAEDLESDDLPNVNKSVKYINRFLKAAKYWSLFCRLAWELGNQETNNI